MSDDRPVLLIEDDPAAADLMRLALKKVGLQRALRVLHDGDEAVAYLSNLPPFENPMENPQPCLMLLDMKLPRRSGLEVLSWLRSWSTTRPLPVIMLTCSDYSKDIEEALRLGVRSYCVKPADFDELKKFARTIRRRVEGPDVDADQQIAPPSGARHRGS